MLNSKAFYGGIGANVQSLYSVNELEQDENRVLLLDHAIQSIKRNDARESRSALKSMEEITEEGWSAYGQQSGYLLE